MARNWVRPEGWENSGTPGRLVIVIESNKVYTALFQGGKMQNIFKYALAAMSFVTAGGVLAQQTIAPKNQAKEKPKQENKQTYGFESADGSVRIFINGKEVSFDQLKKEGKVRILSNEEMNQFFKNMKSFEDIRPQIFKEMKAGDGAFFVTPDGKTFKSADGHVFEGVKIQDGKVQYIKPDSKEFKEALKARDKALEELKLSQKDHEQAMKEHAKAMKELKIVAPKFDEKEFKKHMEEMKKALKESEGAHKMSEKEIQKMMEEMHKSFEGKHFEELKMLESLPFADGKNIKIFKDGKALSPKEMKDFKLDEKAMMELEKVKTIAPMHMDMKDFKGLEKLRELSPFSGKEGSFSKFKTNVDSIKELIKSLSVRQMEMNRRQGFLKVSDLTEAQRKLLGGIKEGDNITMSYTIDGQSITIKGK